MSIVDVCEMTRKQFAERWFGKHVLENCKRDLDALVATERRKAVETLKKDFDELMEIAEKMNERLLKNHEKTVLFGKTIIDECPVCLFEELKSKRAGKGE